MFNPGLEIGQILKNSEIVEIFKCGNMGGMRRSKTTNTLVIVSDYTKGLYHDKWIGGVLHYGLHKIDGEFEAIIKGMFNVGVDADTKKVLAQINATMKDIRKNGCAM